jgi:hypothetical protein
MSKAARGSAPVWREAPAAFPHSVTLQLDARRYKALRRLALDLDSTAAVLLRTLIDDAEAHPEQLDRLRPSIAAETAAVRRRKN